MVPVNVIVGLEALRRRHRQLNQEICRTLDALDKPRRRALYIRGRELSDIAMNENKAHQHVLFLLMSGNYALTNPVVAEVANLVQTYGPELDQLNGTASRKALHSLERCRRRLLVARMHPLAVSLATANARARFDHWARTRMLVGQHYDDLADAVVADTSVS
jgi:hypothetical protein